MPRRKVASFTAAADGSVTGSFAVPTSKLVGATIDVSAGNVAEVQVITLTGFGGTDSFKLTYDGSESIAFVRGTNAAAADLEAELQTLTGDVGLAVTGTTDAGPYTVTFSDTFGNALDLSATSPSGCTGAVTTSTPGNAPVVALASLGRTIITATDVAADTFLPISELLCKSDGTASTTYSAKGAIIHEAVTVTITGAADSAIITVAIFYVD